MKRALFLIALAAGHCVGAAMQYAEVDANGSTLTDGPVAGNATIPFASFGSGGATGFGYANATPGSLHALIAVSATNGSVDGSAHAWTEGMVTFTCGGLCGSTTTVSLNLDIDGSGGQTGNFAFGDITSTLHGTSFGFTRHVGAIGGIPFGPDFTLVNYLYTTPNFTVPVDTPVPLRVTLRAFAAAYSPNTGVTTTAFIDFANTVHLSTLGPVFNLPAGYTANSLDLNIVDNQFSPVPEPATWAMLGTALILTGLYRRRH